MFADYQQAGITVTGIVGIDALPPCGVTTTLDLRASLEVVAACPAAALTREIMNPTPHFRPKKISSVMMPLDVATG